MMDAGSLYESFRAVYALLKKTVGIPRGKNGTGVRFFLVVGTFFSILLSSLLLTICWLCFTGMKAYLKWKEGGRFAAMMTGQDVALRNLYIHTLFAFRATTETYEEVRGKLKPFARTLYESCEKLRYSTKSCLGYGYYVKSPLALDDFIREVQLDAGSHWSKEALLEHIEDTLLKPTVLKDRVWQLLLFKQPVRWQDESDKYTCILSFSHCVGDGIAILSLLKNRVCDRLQFLDLVTNVKAPKTKSLDDAFVFAQIGNEKRQKCKKGEGRPLLTFFVEDEPKYVPLIKRLKNKLKVRFSDILLAGISVAYMEYSAKKNRHLPNLKVNYTMRPFDAKTVQMMKGNYDYDKLTNNVFIAAMSLNGETSKNMLKTVFDLHRMSQEYLEASNLVLTKILASVAHLYPWFAQAMFDKVVVGMNITLTNVTGVVSAEICGYEVEDMAFFESSVTSNFSEIVDLMFYVITHSDKFRISVGTETNVVDNKEDLNAIVVKAFEHIQSLDNECP